jgi:hypothetical protein
MSIQRLRIATLGLVTLTLLSCGPLRSSPTPSAPTASAPTFAAAPAAGTSTPPAPTAVSASATPTAESAVPTPVAVVSPTPNSTAVLNAKPTGTTVGQSASNPDPARPVFSDVTSRTPTDGVAYLRGKLPEYPGSSPDWVMRFSSSDILETMDTTVLDQIKDQKGQAALDQVYAIIARSVLDTIKEVYGDSWVVVPLDAGHGGYRPIFWDTGSNGTEATHTRAVVATMEKLAASPEYSRIILKRVFNDSVPESFGLSSAMDEPSVDASLIRQIRASMLAHEAQVWNENHGPDDQVIVQEISIHFNAGSDGSLVLHQGTTVSPTFQQQSIDFGKAYLHRAVPALNASGILPAPLKLFGADGLHDDLMMYNPDLGGPHASEDQGLTLRYGMLQTNDYTPYYISKVLKYGLGSSGHA